MNYDSIEEKRKLDFYDMEKMIYVELPELVGKITAAAFGNAECGSTMILEEDLKMIMPTMETMRDVFRVEYESSCKKLKELVKIHEK